jgi:hypothetical protein
VDDAVRLPDEVTIEVELDLDEPAFAELRLRAEREGLAPSDTDALKRYLVCLGIGYLEAEGVVADAHGAGEAFERIHRLPGAVEGELAVLRFHYSESAREFA